VIQNKIQNKNYDVIIVGSGPAGISLAINLNKNFNIALIESGLKNYSAKHQDTYKGELVGEFPRESHISRLKMFGGTTGHWGGTCRPLDEYDFNHWPIKKKILDPYLNEASKILEIKNQFREMLFPNTENLKLIEFQVSKIRFREKYYDKIKKSKNIDLYMNATFIKMIGDNKIFKKAVINHFNKNSEISAKYIVFAAGGIENSRILLLEDLENKNKLFNKDLPIGNYWFEHPFKELGKAITDEKKISKRLDNSFNHFVNMFNAGDKAMTYSVAPTERFIKKNKILNSCIWIVLHRRSYSDWKNITKNLLCVSPKFSEKLLKFLDRKISCGTTMYSSWEQEPEKDNRIVLSNKLKDEFLRPSSKIIYKKSKLVRDTAKTFIQEIARYYLNEDIGRVSAYSFLFNNEKYISEAGWHHMGGTRMGSDPKKSVVDKNLRLFGSQNVYIAGSSVFPSGGHANPTITIIQLSLRLAEHLNKKITQKNYGYLIN
jgi:hypothetical protein